MRCTTEEEEELRKSIKIRPGWGGGPRQSQPSALGGGVVLVAPRVGKLQLLDLGAVADEVGVSLDKGGRKERRKNVSALQREREGEEGEGEG